MRVLLDTHAMYWYIEGDPQLSVTARTLIQDASNVILISPASYRHNSHYGILTASLHVKYHSLRAFDALLDPHQELHRIPTID